MKKILLLVALIATLSGTPGITPSMQTLIQKGIQELADEDGADLPGQTLAAVGVYGFWNDYMNTGDRAAVEAVLPAIKEYLETCKEGEDGLLEWDDGDGSQDKRLLQNMWYVLALQSVTNMEDMLGEIVTGRVYRGRMNRLKDAINRVAWTGSCYRHPDYKGQTDKRVQALAVVAEIAWKDKYDAIFELLKKENHAGPGMEKYVMEALFRMGHGDYALARNRDWRGARVLLPVKMFGIAPVQAGWRRFSISPDRHILNNSALSIPTVKGTVAVSFKRKGKAIHMDVEVPEGSLAHVHIPWADYIRNLGPGKHSLDLGRGPVFEAGNFPYRDKNQPVEKRVEDLLGRMSLEEKVCQVSAELVNVDEWHKRDYTKGLVRTIVHFFPSWNLPNDPRSVAEVINGDTRLSILANRWGIPVLQHCEALHGAMWGKATSFPQSIAMAATFDDAFYHRVAQVIAKEVRAVGVRQVLSPVVNISRDPRWGRTQEGYGEDVLLNSAMGVAFVKALEQGGIVTTPKHYVDNYGEGGRDSYASTNSWRVLREVFLEPFRACVQEGGARGIMSSYNSVDGIPASCNGVLLGDILKKEWGFKGIVVTDYDAVDIVRRHHGLAETEDEALALCMENGLDVELHITSLGLLDLVQEGKVSGKTLDEAVRRVLRLKFELGLFDEPYVDPDKAASQVHTPEHQQLAYEAACKVMTLLKNDGTLPLKPGSVKKIGVFGPAADQLNLGNYRRPGGRWEGDGVTPLEGLRKAFEGSAEVVLNEGGQNVQSLAATCDALLFFPSIIEDEGRDRSSFSLPTAKVRDREETGGLVVDTQEAPVITIDQEKMVRDLIATGKPVIVVLQNGGIIDITDWVDGAAAVLEAWYPGEQGGRAIADVIIGAVNPGGRLPISWSRNIGQTPMYYSIKPSGRGYGYIENDGKPLYPFGYGLSYTSFEYSNLRIPDKLGKDESLKLSVTVKNTGEVAGDEVVQVYIHDILASVVRPMKELAAFKRVSLKPGESKEVEIEVPYRRFGMWDKDLRFGVEEGWFEVWLGKNADEKVLPEGQVYVLR